MGPLEGLRIIEIAGIGPAPFCAMLLADLGAEVVRVDRIEGSEPRATTPFVDATTRGRRSIAVDLKHPDGADLLLDLVARADALIEGFRPGVLERLGVGPAECLDRNPRLVFGRVTGWGQEGPLAPTAGHDINYIALAGVLDAIGRRGDAPVPPLNLVADYGGGGMLLALGVLAAILRARQDGRGQVIDASMVDGAALLATLFSGLRQAGLWNPQRGTNILDTGAPYYDVYRCADGKHVAVGAIEPEFYAELVARLGLDAGELPDRDDADRWPELRARLAEAFAARGRDEWGRVFEGSDACVSPVLSMEEAAAHPHNRARGTFVDAFGLRQPAPAPRFGETPGAIRSPPPAPGEHTREALADWGVDRERIDELVRRGAIG